LIREPTGRPMRIVYFTHSLRSCWNHGNAHFLRGVLRELIAQGHDVVAYEPAKSWSMENLLKDHGEAGLEPYLQAYPELSSTTFAGRPPLTRMLDGADSPCCSTTLITAPSASPRR
jgi:hypothetical protein